MSSIRLIVISFLMVIISVVSNYLDDKIPSVDKQVRNLTVTLQKKIDLTHELIEKARHKDEMSLQSIIEEAENNGIILQEYIQDSLVFWTSNSVSAIQSKELNDKELKVAKYFNKWYVTLCSEIDSSKYIGLMPFKSEYPYENKFLYSGFRSDFKFDLKAEVKQKKISDEKVICDKDNNPLFYLKIIDAKIENVWLNVFSTICIFVAIITFLFAIYTKIKSYQPGYRRNVIILSVSAAVIGLRILKLWLFPLNDSQFLFDPAIYAHTWLMPSLADLVINTLLIMFVSVLIQKYFHFKTVYFSGERKSQDIIISILNLGYLLLFLYTHFICYSLVQNSTISFKPFETEQISIYTILAFFIIGINFTIIALYCEWLFRTVEEKIKFTRMLLHIFLMSIPYGLLLYIFRYPGDFVSYLFILIFYTVFYLLLQFRKRSKPLPFLVTLILIITLYSVYLLTQQVRIKDILIKKSMVEGLTNEHDPVAEYLFTDLEYKLLSDASVGSMLRSDDIDLADLYVYLEKNIFNGFWKKYHLKITVCTPVDSVSVDYPFEIWHHCYEFFDKMKERGSMRIPGSNFYYLDNYNGSISYLGELAYPLPDEREEITLFVELDSKLTIEQLGYPELLIDDKFRTQKYLTSFSSAKYYQNYLVAHTGDYEYSLYPDIFGNNQARYAIIMLDNHEHLIYKIDEDNLIVASTPSIRIFDLMVTFSYLFVFFYTIVFIISLVMRRPLFQTVYQYNFRTKIQLVIVAILIISLIFIGTITVFFTQNTYQENQYNILSEKVQSVYVELDHKLALANDLRGGWSDSKYDNLDQLLIKFSDVFYSDINLFDPEGNLLATSRSEVFDLGLQSEKINPTAYYKLRTETRAQFVHKESIDKLEYLSAYTPFFNVDNELLAYLNLPYFTKQKEFQEEISRLVVAIINVYVFLLFITLIIAIIISNQLTRPLELLQLKFRDFDISKKYNTIKYSRNDEIGNLVSEYNRMVLELEESVQLLAKSERESAWREMAKQIAHEIKNPLTPMKLSVQQLQRTIKDKKKGYEAYLENVTQTLIEQIDNLSIIASEFSNFAKMPTAKIEKLELNKIIQNTIHLFTQSKDYEIRSEFKNREVWIKADKEQFSRVIINLIKNAIQSVPDNRKGIIEIKQSIKGKHVTIEVSDNGKGIPEELHQKLFVPNFTTKTAGMGLGLAIVKNVVEQIKGEIHFDTIVGKGSKFTISIPLIEVT